MNTSLLLPMRDNVTLFALLFLPDDIPQPVGTVLIRTPYDTSSQAPLCAALADIGFACLVADERGKHQSGGVYTMWASASNDTADTIAFLVTQSWSNKRFAWTGGSANAIMGFVEPLDSSPLGLMKSQFNLVGTARLKGLEYQDGAFREELIQNWLKENQSPEFIPVVKAHERWSPFWARWKISGRAWLRRWSKWWRSRKNAVWFVVSTLSRCGSSRCTSGPRSSSQYSATERICSARSRRSRRPRIIANLWARITMPA
jgi:predicted acyl esterase